MQEGVSMYL